MTADDLAPKRNGALAEPPLCGRNDPYRHGCEVVGQAMTMTPLAEALHRDAAVLMEAYRTGQWTPTPSEHELAEDLARGHWNATYFRASLRELPPAARSGRLIEILAPAAEVFDRESVVQDLALQLRRLTDAIATEQRPTGAR
ncbi:hypothetical protein ACH4UR_25340 [Streptomyces lydicus]|uniref:hypothetical protein n=1 Tax=Streptomyces lydicus TaxID=47763 RepID=UPI00340C957B